MKPIAATLLSLVCLITPLSTPGEEAAIGVKPVTVRMQTSQGEIVLELDAEKAPRTVENFLEYARAGFYDGTIFIESYPNS